MQCKYFSEDLEKKLKLIIELNNPQKLYGVSLYRYLRRLDRQGKIVIEEYQDDDDKTVYIYEQSPNALKPLLEVILWKVNNHVDK